MKLALQKTYAWSVHLFTAFGAVFGVLALLAATQAYAAKGHDMASYTSYLKLSFLYVVVTIIIDATDGTLARRVDIKKLAPFDGALLDNIVDFMTYAVVPSVWIYVTDVVPDGYKLLSIVLVILAASYQFCQNDAKTEDHFFKGFPSYWNIAIYYLIYFGLSGITNFIVIAVLAVLTFIPIKYIYPSRMDNVSKSLFIRVLILVITILWGSITIASAYMWPVSHIYFVIPILSYCFFYFALSLWCTFR